ncbi:MAG TPA: flippase-like domain-containing protein [Actinomycetota bacterium]|nr:flippase-like domain-containing protein [Actinomycetota bacterium]
MFGDDRGLPFLAMIAGFLVALMLVSWLVGRHEGLIRKCWSQLLDLSLIRSLRRGYADRRRVLMSRLDPTGLLRLYLVLGLVLTVGLISAVAAGIQALFDHPGVSAWDIPASRFMTSNRRPFITAGMRVITELGGVPFLTVGTLAAAVVLIRKAGSFKPAVFLMAAVFGGQAVKTLVKLVLHRPRPAGQLTYESTYSFPSGHAVAAVTLFGGIALLISRRDISWIAKTWAWAGAIALTFLIGVSRVYLGAHYPSDVMGGVVLGVVLLAVSAAALTVWEELDRPEKLKRARNRVAGQAVKWSLVAVSLGIVVHVVLLALPGIEESGAALRRVRPGYVLLALGLEAVALLALAQLYRRTLQELGGQVSFRRGVAISMGGFTIGRVLPGGGATAGLFMAREMTLAGNPAATATSAALIGGMLGMAVLGVVVLTGGVTTVFRDEVSTAYLILIAVLLAAFVAAFALMVRILRSESVRSTVFGWVEAVLKALRVNVNLETPLKFMEDVSSALPPLRRLAGPAAWSALNWLADAAALWVLFLGFRHWLHPGVLLVGFGVAQVVTALPVSPGGVGLVETGLAATYVAFGVPHGVAIVTVLAYRLASYWLPVAAGVPAYLRGASRRGEEEPAAVSESVA